MHTAVVTMSTAVFVETLMAFSSDPQGLLEAVGLFLQVAEK
jgi:hypothetical protein